MISKLARSVRMPSPATVLAFAAVLFAMGGLAIAAIPGGNGTISACYQKKTGALRVVQQGKRCAKGEKKLAWSQRGPAGPAGQKGDPGERGAQGAPGVPATKLWAALRADGTMARGSSGAVASEKISAGFYEVTFDQNVSQCGFFTSIGSPGGLEIPPGQSGASQNIGGGFSNLPTQVLVSTTNSAGAVADTPVFLFVVC